jgi:hypothetical protein
MMRTGRAALVTAAAIGVLLLGAVPAAAQGWPVGNDGVLVWNEDYELAAGDVREADLVVINGDVALRPDSRVEGTVVVWNGDVSVDGRIEGDLVVSGGTVALGENGVVLGNLICSWSCDLVQEEGARIEGDTVQGIFGELLDVEWLRDLRISVPATGQAWLAGWRRGVGSVLDLVRTAFGIAVVTALAALVAGLWPEQTSQVGKVVVAEPVVTAGVGVLTAVVAGVLVIGLAITVCLSPVALVAGLALVAAGLFGWTCVGAVAGERLLRALNVRPVAAPWAAALGTFLVSVLSAGGSLVPGIGCCVGPLGWLVALAVGCLGLGAVVLTRFGTARYPSAEPAPRPRRQAGNSKEEEQ